MAVGTRQTRPSGPSSASAAARYYGEESTLIELSPVRHVWILGIPCMMMMIGWAVNALLFVTVCRSKSCTWLLDLLLWSSSCISLANLLRDSLNSVVQ